MANERGTSVATPGPFTEQPSLARQFANLPGDSGAAGAAVEKVGESLSNTFGAAADELTANEAKKAGTIAGNDPNFRPTGIPTLRGQTYDQAAQDTYVNNLQIQTRANISQAYQDYSLLPQDQKTPDKLQASLAQIQQAALKTQVFPSIQPKYQETFDKLSFPYLQKAQDDHDEYVGATARASFLGNEQSSAGNTVRLASLGTPDGAAAAQQEMQAHANLVDEQVNQGNISPVAGAKLKLALEQNFRQTYELAKFNNVPDAQKPAYVAGFSKAYTAGTTGLINPQAGDEDAPLSFRNNNFTNIRDGAFAKGQPGYVGGESGFAKFATPEAALQAANRNLDSYANRGLDTVAKIVSTWSPPTDGHGHVENDTPALIANMSRRLGYAANQKLDMSDPSVRAKLVGGLVAQETGKAPFTTSDIASVLTGNPTNGLDTNGFKYVANKMQSTLDGIDNANDQLQKASLSEIGAATKQVTQGFDLPGPVWQHLQSSYGSSNDPQVAVAMGQLGQIRSEFAGFKGKTPQEIETTIAQMRPSPEDGTYKDQIPPIVAAQGYLKKYREDLAADPLRRASNEGIISNIQPLDFTKPATLVAGLQSRVPQADTTAARFGTEPTLLLPDEKAQLKKLSLAGGQPMIDAAQAIVQALGPRAGPLFDEAAGDAPKFATAGRVAAWGGSPAFLADFAARQALSRDPSTAKALELPTKTATDPVANDTIGDALYAIPSMNAAVRQGARDVYEKRALDQNLDRQLVAGDAQKVFTRGLQEAAGATFSGDTQYGGIGTRKTGYFSSQKVLAPLDMRADGVGPALSALTDQDLAKLKAPPVAGDLKTPIPASAIQGGQLTSLGHGVYQVSIGDPRGPDPRWVRQPNGRPFVLDLNQLAPVLRQRQPGLYRTP